MSVNPLPPQNLADRNMMWLGFYCAYDKSMLYARNQTAYIEYSSNLFDKFRCFQSKRRIKLEHFIQVQYDAAKVCVRFPKISQGAKIE